jgi:lipoprotein-releasing system permease protein
MKELRLAVFLAIKDMLNNIGSLLFVSAALGFLFANVLFSRFMLHGFETCISRLIPKVSGHAYLNPIRGESYIYNTHEITKKIKSKESIESITPILEMPCVLEYKNSRIVTMVWGIEYNDEVMRLKDHMIKGSYFSGPYAEEIILGNILKRRLKQKIKKHEDIEIGDTIQAIFIKEYNVDKFNKDVYRDKYCTIVGIADFRDYIANNSIFMPIEALRNTTILNNRSSSIFLRLYNGMDFDVSDLAKLTPLTADAELKHWQDRDDYGTDDLVDGFNIISGVIFVVSIICAAILVAFVIFYNTQKKRRETGILRAIGMKDDIFFVFYILEGFLFSIIGVVTGSALYYGLESFLKTHPIVMPFGDLYPIFETKSFIFATSLFLIVSFAASIYYEAKSSKENIITIIRGE